VVDDRWWRGIDAVVAERIGGNGRVLDIGCGDGGFVERLCARGIDAIGVDPRAPVHPRLIAEVVEDVGAIGEFDAVSAVMALHHTKLDVVVAAIRRLLRPGGQLFVYEFAWEVYDARAEAWLAAHDSSAGDNSVARWRLKHTGLHTGVAVRTALATALELREESERPYLARMLGIAELEAEEQALIAAGALPAIGRWYVGRLPNGPEDVTDRLG